MMTRIYLTSWRIQRDRKIFQEGWPKFRLLVYIYYLHFPNLLDFQVHHLQLHRTENIGFYRDTNNLGNHLRWEFREVVWGRHRESVGKSLRGSPILVLASILTFLLFLSDFIKIYLLYRKSHDVSLFYIKSLN